MELQKRIEFLDTVFVQEVDNEMVLLDMNSEDYFGIDEVGADIWRALQRGNCLQDAYESLLKMYDVDPEVLKRDFIAFIDKLRENGLVSVA